MLFYKLHSVKIAGGDKIVVGGEDSKYSKMLFNWRDFFLMRYDKLPFIKSPEAIEYLYEAKKPHTA